MDLQVTLLFLIAGINAVLSLFILLGTRNRTNLIYSIFAVFIALWSVGLGFFIIETDLAKAIYIANAYYIAAAGIPTFFLLFAFNFPERKFKLTLRKGVLIFGPFIALIACFLYDKHFLIDEVFLTPAGKDVLLNNLNYLAYALYFVIILGSAYAVLFKNFKSATDKVERSQLKFVIGGTIFAFLLGMLFNLIFPYVGNYQYIWIGPLFTLLMVVSIAYAVAKHHLFDIKVVATELLTFGLWFFILVRTLIAETPKEQLINGALLFVTVIFGILLIRGVLKEVETREKIQKLATDLEKTNKDLGNANERLKELDQLKTEFVSLATHQIRGPLTAIRGYTSLILDGDFGHVSDALKDPLDKIMSSSKHLITTVQDFLDISRIEQGRMKYDMATFDLRTMAEEAVGELKPNVEKAGLKITFKADKGAHYLVNGDIGKLRQVVQNLVDNAQKYTKEGTITVSLTKSSDHKKVILSVSDTGVGIDKETIPKLFQKFTRAKDANKTNVLGTGLGLYVAREMIKAHNGRIWVESEGVGKGSTFFIELEASK